MVETRGLTQLALAVRLVVLLAAAALWLAGLRLFLRTDLSRRRKVGWSAFLLLVGIGIGVALPLEEVWTKLLWLLAILPVLGAVDVLLLKSRHGLSFWIRACGFEVLTVFAAAAAARWLLDLAGLPALLYSATYISRVSR